VTFEDGTKARGYLLVACDGGASRVRRVLFPDIERYRLPVRTMGLRVDCTPREMRCIRAMDPFFLQAASSENDTFLYFSGKTFLGSLVPLIATRLSTVYHTLAGGTTFPRGGHLDVGKREDSMTLRDIAF
jgi:2-polyprenyl-6-methoxyphenol hydroxylase-like FAD-dependent oxidoreductase